MNITCEICGGNYVLLNDNLATEIYKCDICGHEKAVRVHYLDAPVPLGTKTFRALVDASNSTATKKLRIKVKNVFAGRSNFHLDKLDIQISKSEKIWDLGLYSEREVSELAINAKKIGLDLNFKLITK